MIFDPNVLNIPYSSYLFYFLSDSVNLIFCTVILFIFYIYKKINNFEFIFWFIGFALVIPLNFLAEIYNFFPDLGGYLVCLRDLRENFIFEYPECTITFMSSAEEESEAIGIFSLKRQIPALIYFLFPIPSIANFASIGFINKVILFFTYLFVKNHISDNQDRMLLLLLFFLPTILLYSSIGIRDNLIFCFSLIFLIYTLKERFLLSSLILAIIFSIKLQNAISLAILFLGIYIFQAHKRLPNFILFLISMLIIFVLFQDTITEVINYFRIAFLNEVGLLTPNEIFDGFQSVWQLVVLSPFSFIKGILAPLPTNPFNIIFFTESLFLIGISIYLILKNRKNMNFLQTIIVFMVTYSGIVLNVFVVENDFTLLRYKFTFLNLFIVYLILIQEASYKHQNK